LAIVGAISAVLSLVRVTSACTTKLTAIFAEWKKAPQYIQELLQSQNKY